MSSRDQISRLEGLLDRVRRNASSRPAATPDRRAPEPPLPATPTPAPVLAAPAPAPVFAPPPEPPPPPELVPVNPVAAAPSPPVWQPEPGSSVQARPSTVPPEELSDDDLLEVTTIPPEADDYAVSVSSNREPATDEPTLVDDEAPVSSSRSKVAETIDQALASAVEMDEGREVPVKTPPPESGPQAAGPPQGLEASRVPDVDGLEADMLGPPSMGPTAEQLGETIELDAPTGPELEIDVAAGEVGPEAERPHEELEVALPRAQMPSGMYDVPIVPTAPSPPSPPAPVSPVSEPADLGGVPAVASEPQKLGRPELGAAEVARVVLGRPLGPQSFLDLLDHSLGL